MGKRKQRQDRPAAPGPTSAGSSSPERRTPERSARTPKRIAVTGATGMLGRALCARLIARGDEVLVVSRDTTTAEHRIRGAAAYVGWNGINVGPWVRALEGCDAVVHLAGSPWRAEDRHLVSREFTRSRVLATRAVVEGVAGLRQRPAALLSASSAHVYGLHQRDDRPIGEREPVGGDATSRSLRDWEQAALGAREHEMRTVLLRFGAVLAPHEGMLPLMVSLFDRHLGGTLLPARGWRPWVHLDDAVGLMMLALDEPRLSGPLNVVAPEPLRSRDFSRLLARHLGRSAWLPLPRSLFTRLAGEAAAIQLKPVKRVMPEAALAHDYVFQHPDAGSALADLVVARREERSLSSGATSEQQSG